MDEFQFDQALKAFARASGRRDALRSLSLAGVALLTAIGLSAGADAKKKGKKNKKCKGNTKKCGKKCIPSANCCSSAECDGGTCVDGTCQCLSGVKACNGACIPEEHCCADSDCDDGNACTTQNCNGNGTCSNPNRPDLSYCGSNNLCSGGVCATYPGCLDTGMTGCIVHANCCNNFCFIPPGQTFGFCLGPSDPGEYCHRSEFCNNSTCVGFVCTQ